MAFNLSDIADSRQEELEKAIRTAQKSSTDTQALQLLLTALEEVRDAVTESAASEVTVTNQDVVKAEIRNSLNKLSQNVIKAIDGLKLDRNKIEQIKQKIETDNAMALTDRFDLTVTPKPKARIQVDNLSDITFPDSINVGNLSEVQSYFNDLAQVIRDNFKIDIPAPQVTVEPPQVNVPEIVIPESSVSLDVDSLLKALDPLKYLSDRAKKPLSVRLSDGTSFLKTIRTIVDNQQKQMAAFSQGLNESSARKAFKSAVRGAVGGVGSLELTSAGTAVRLTSTSTPIKYVDISTNAGLANVGTSSAVQTSGSEVGVTLYPGNLPYRVEANNLTDVYAAGASGTRLSWTYYV